eukprot:2727645-Alexandrium_andersonii.AAC.1
METSKARAQQEATVNSVSGTTNTSERGAKRNIVDNTARMIMWDNKSTCLAKRIQDAWHLTARCLQAHAQAC